MLYCPARLSTVMIQISALALIKLLIFYLGAKLFSNSSLISLSIKVDREYFRWQFSIHFSPKPLEIYS